MREAAQTSHSSHERAARGISLSSALVFVIIAVALIAVDRLTKAFFEGLGATGARSISGIDGLFSFTLVHNQGAAWGIFSDSTIALGVVSLVVCTAIVVVFLLFGRDGGWLMTVSCAMVFAGGIGNAVDRFCQGYVIDFIELDFMDFPVFNVADICVTCGVVLLAIAILRSPLLKEGR